MWKNRILARAIRIQKKIEGNHAFSEIIELKFGKKLPYILTLAIGSAFPHSRNLFKNTYVLGATVLKEARKSFFGPGVYLLKSKFHIEDKFDFLDTIPTFQQMTKIYFYWFPSNSCRHSKGYGQPLVSYNVDYLEIYSVTLR